MKIIPISLVLLSLIACSDSSIIYENPGELAEPYKIKLHEVKVVSETDDSLTLDFVYTYNEQVPADEIKLFVTPDHGYWRTMPAKIASGTNAARVIIGLSPTNMKKDHVTESDTTKLHFRFEHYKPGKYLGNIWGEDVSYHKHWVLQKV